MNCAKFINDDTLDQYCLISGTKFTKEDFANNNVVQLKCGHIFLYESILESYKITNNKGRNYLSKQLCPYCLQKGGLLPIKENIQYIKGVNYKSKNITMNNLDNKVFKCCAKLKSGPNKGQLCNNNCKITFTTLEYKPFYILDIDITGDDKKKIKISLKSKTWCRKHSKQCKMFIKDAITLKKYTSEENTFVKICYKPKFGYIYTFPKNIKLIYNLIDNQYNNFINTIDLQIDKIAKKIYLINIVNYLEILKKKFTDKKKLVQNLIRYEKNKITKSVVN